MNNKRILLSLLCCWVSCHFLLAQNIQIQKGILDLRKWKVEEQPTFSLNGEWAFHWEKLLSKSEIRQNSSQSYITVPGSWTNRKDNQVSLPSKGYATYYLKVILPKNFNKELALKMPSVGTAYRLFIDNQLLFETGKVATIKEEAQAEYYTQNINFKPQNNTFFIIIQVSNYHHRKGGIWESIRFGSSSHIQKQREHKIIADCIMFGIMFMMFFYHMALYSFPPYQKSALYFSLGCLFASIRVLVVEEYMMNEIFRLPWQWLFKIEYLTFFLPIYIFPAFFRELFPQNFSTKFLLFLKWTILPLSAFCLVVPPFYTTFLTIPVQFLFVLMNLYLLFFLVSLQKNTLEVIIFQMGIFAIFLTTINDILYVEDIIDSFFLSSYGFMIFLFIQAYLISMQFANSFKKSEKLSQELSILNNRLEERIVERTASLIDANQTLSEQKDKITVQNQELTQKNKLLEKLNQQLESLNDEKDALIDIVAHDLKAPLNRVKGLADLIRLTRSLNQEGELYLEKVETVCRNGEELIQDLLKISSLEKELNEELIFNRIDLESFFKNIQQDYQSIAENKNITLHLNLINHQSPFILSEVGYLTRILDNLLSNAIKFSYPQSNIWFKVEYTLPDKMMIYIKDEGQGMNEDDKNKLFKKFQKLSARPTAGESSSGLGLSIVKALVEKLQGTIEVKSELGKGTEFIIELPTHYEINSKVQIKTFQK